MHINRLRPERQRTGERFHQKHGLLGTAGIHPHSTDTAREEDLQRIREIILTNPAIRMVGETGLDYDHMYAKKKTSCTISKNSSPWPKNCINPCSSI